MPRVQDIKAKNRKQLNQANKKGAGEKRKKEDVKNVGQVALKPLRKLENEISQIPLITPHQELQDVCEKSQELTRVFLNLNCPVIDDNVSVFLEYYGIQILLKELYQTEIIEYPKDILQECTQRRVNGLKVVQVLTSECNLEYTKSKRFEIIQDIFKVYSVHSQVSTTAFKILYMYIIQKWDDVADFVLEKDWIWVLLRYVLDSNTMDCIMITVFKYAQEEREKRQKRFMKLVEMEFMDELFRLLNSQKSEVQELTGRIVRESVSTPDGHMLYMNLIGGHNPLSEFVFKIAKGQEVGFDVLHDMITAVPSLNGMGFVGWTPIFEPRNTAIEYLLPNLKEFCQHHYKNAKSNTKKLYTLEILIVILQVSQTQDLDVFDCLPLKESTFDFFNRYHNNSIFQTRFYKLICSLMDLVPAIKLAELLDSSNLVQELVTKYREKNENRGFIQLLIQQLNHLAEKEEIVKTCLFLQAEWDDLSNMIENELRMQKVSKYPSPPPKLVAAKAEDEIPTVFIK